MMYLCRVMERIRLTKAEKMTLRYIADGGTFHTDRIAPPEYVCGAYGLGEKGLINVCWNGYTIVDAKLSMLGKAYLADNPKLRNPISTPMLVIASAIITAINLLRLYIKLN